MAAGVKVAHCRHCGMSITRHVYQPPKPSKCLYRETTFEVITCARCNEDVLFTDNDVAADIPGDMGYDGCERCP